MCVYNAKNMILCAARYFVNCVYFMSCYIDLCEKGKLAFLIARPNLTFLTETGQVYIYSLQIFLIPVFLRIEYLGIRVQYNALPRRHFYPVGKLVIDIYCIPYIPELVFCLNKVIIIIG